MGEHNSNATYRAFNYPHHTASYWAMYVGQLAEHPHPKLVPQALDFGPSTLRSHHRPRPHRTPTAHPISDPLEDGSKLPLPIHADMRDIDGFIAFLRLTFARRA